MPSLLQDELKTNPFLRTGVANVVAAAEKHAGHDLETSEAVFTELRQWKDREYD